MPPAAALAIPLLAGGAAGAAGLGGLTLGTGLLAGGAAGGALASALSQADALEQAGDIAGAEQLRTQTIEQQKLEMAQQLFNLGTPGREAVAGFGPQIANQLGGFANLQNVGTGPVFQAQLEAGLSGLNRSLAPSGVIDSSISDRLRSGLTSNLLQNDLQSRLQVASNLLGQGTGTSGATNLFGQTGGFSPGAAQQAQLAGISPQANLFGDIR